MDCRKPDSTTEAGRVILLPMWDYWKSVWIQADEEFTRRLRDWRERVIGFLIQTAILFVMLYFQPWFGHFDDEAKLVFAFAFSVLLSAFIVFLGQLLRMPFEMSSRQTNEIKNLHASIATLTTQRVDEGTKIYICNHLTVLRSQAFFLFNQRITDPEYSEWLNTVNEWTEVAVAFLRNNISAEIADRFGGIRFNPKTQIPFKIHEQHQEQLLALNRRIEIMEGTIDDYKPYWGVITPAQGKEIENNLTRIRDAFRSRRGQQDKQA